MRLSGATDFALLHRLIGQHALWWDRAIRYVEHEHLREPLRDLADWVRGYTEEHPDLSYTATCTYSSCAPRWSATSAKLSHPYATIRPATRPDGHRPPPKFHGTRDMLAAVSN